MYNTLLDLIHYSDEKRRNHLDHEENNHQFYNLFNSKATYILHQNFYRSRSLFIHSLSATEIAHIAKKKIISFKQKKRKVIMHSY